jgi:hypothetical protein
MPNRRLIGPWSPIPINRIVFAGAAFLCAALTLRPEDARESATGTPPLSAQPLPLSASPSGTLRPHEAGGSESLSQGFLSQNPDERQSRDESPFACSGEGYTVRFARDGRSAAVIGGDQPRFAELGCQLDAAGTELHCFSRDVVDAGYAMSLKRGASRYEASLSEIWVGGTRNPVTLHCSW